MSVVDELVSPGTRKSLLVDVFMPDMRWMFKAKVSFESLSLADKVVHNTDESEFVIESPGWQSAADLSRCRLVQFPFERKCFALIPELTRIRRRSFLYSMGVKSFSVGVVISVQTGMDEGEDMNSLSVVERLSAKVSRFCLILLLLFVLSCRSNSDNAAKRFDS